MIWADWWDWNSTTGQLTVEQSLDLTKGIYYFVISEFDHYCDGSGKYEFKINFSSVSDSFQNLRVLITIPLQLLIQCLWIQHITDILRLTIKVTFTNLHFHRQKLWILCLNQKFVNCMTQTETNFGVQIHAGMTKQKIRSPTWTGFCLLFIIHFVGLFFGTAKLCLCKNIWQV